MKLRTVVAAVMFGLATLACGGGGDLGDWEGADYSTPLTSPWTDMGVPIADGTVIISDDSTLSIQYASSVDDQIAAWTGYYSGNGFSESFNQKNDDGSLTAIYDKDGKSYTLVIVNALGQTLVTMTIT